MSVALPCAKKLPTEKQKQKKKNTEKLKKKRISKFLVVCLLKFLFCFPSLLNHQMDESLHMDMAMAMATSDASEDAHMSSSPHGCSRRDPSHNGQAAAVDSSSMSGRSDGWPLGLIMRLPARAILIESVQCSSFLSASSSALAGDAIDSSSALAKYGSMSLAVPSSITSASWSSSDLDTEVSFCGRSPLIMSLIMPLIMSLIMSLNHAINHVTNHAP